MPKINLKIASKNDFNFLLFLRNQRVIRNISLNKNKIGINEHSNWIKSFSSNKHNKIYIVLSGKEKIGYIRYSFIYLNIYEISICLKKKYHSKNIGSIALEKSEQNFNNDSIIVSKILIKNKISQNFFEKNNYTILKKKKNEIYFYKILHKNYKNNYLKVIDSIENARKKNNLNWMRLLKLSFMINPNETKKIFKKISITDNKINKLSYKLIK